MTAWAHRRIAIECRRQQAWDDLSLEREEPTVARVTIDDMLRQARHGLIRLSPQQAYRSLVAGGGVLVDVRTSDNRRRDGRLPDAIEIPLNVLEWRMDPGSPARHPSGPDLDDLVVVICEQGYSSSLAAARLQQLGFSHATDVKGGFEAWRTASMPIRQIERTTRVVT